MSLQSQHTKRASAQGFKPFWLNGTRRRDIPLKQTLPRALRRCSFRLNAGKFLPVFLYLYLVILSFRSLLIVYISSACIRRLRNPVKYRACSALSKEAKCRNLAFKNSLYKLYILVVAIKALRRKRNPYLKVYDIGGVILRATMPLPHKSQGAPYRRLTKRVH